MDLTALTMYLYEYGFVLLFILVFLEYLNIPGFPAGMILPAAGFLIRQGNMNFWLALFVSVSAGALGSAFAYSIGKLGGQRILLFLTKRSPKQQRYVEKCIQLIEKQGTKIILVAKLIPIVRTLIGILAGTLNMNFITYMFYSSLGVAIWNSVFMSMGYLLPRFNEAFTMM
ncbi:DedA family protein [Sporanaerobium hydrogeniformans]|uniref:DedA family protein n=1 Tax=Sporanaerobium hydrogeniformans TaxID=3072179 RepID=UPI0015D46E03|nr:DedA family protein [Sporanaerobium hydrogeniformans]